MARPNDRDQAMYVISVAAELAGMHPQTLRVYERKGLLSPQRTRGNTRRYSVGDIELLRKIQDLTHEGINLAGVTKILELEHTIEDLRRRYESARREIEKLEQRMNEMLDARESFALVPLRDVRRVRRAMKSDAIEQAGRRRIFTAGPAEEKER